MVLEIIDLELELMDLVELPLDSVFKCKDCGRRCEDFFTQVLLDQRDDRLGTSEIGVKDSLTRKHWSIPSKTEERVGYSSISLQWWLQVCRSCSL